MADYRPAMPFNVPMLLLIPTVKTVRGVAVKEFPKTGTLIYCNFRSFGGTETQSNGVTIVEDTATIETWFRPDITANCGVCFADNPDKVYEILGTPENISMRNQFMQFKVRSIGGGA